MFGVNTPAWFTALVTSSEAMRPMVWTSSPPAGIPHSRRVSTRALRTPGTSAAEGGSEKVRSVRQSAVVFIVIISMWRRAGVWNSIPI